MDVDSKEGVYIPHYRSVVRLHVETIRHNSNPDLYLSPQVSCIPPRCRDMFSPAPVVPYRLPHTFLWSDTEPCWCNLDGHLIPSHLSYSILLTLDSILLRHGTPSPKVHPLLDPPGPARFFGSDTPQTTLRIDDGNEQLKMGLGYLYTRV